MDKWSRVRLTTAADVIVRLHPDGTYIIEKDKMANFEPRDEVVYGIRKVGKLKPVRVFFGEFLKEEKK